MKVISRDFFLFCGIDREAYQAIRPLIWRRNISTLTITSILAAGMGLAFLLINHLMGSGVWIPYVFIFCGSAVILTILVLTRRRCGEGLGMLLCYGEMLLVCVYAGLLSTQETNYAIPATSVVVFIALLPQSIDDRPIRMYAVMLLESAGYLAVSYFMKSSHAFSLDAMNIATFFVVGVILYAVICTRNVRELYQSIRVERIQKNTIAALAAVVEERDENTGGHIQRTEDYVMRLSEGMKKRGRYARLTDEYYRNVITAAPMHDIGKIKIPDGILNKPGRLDEQEFAVMKNHAAYGGEIIRRTMSRMEDQEYVQIAYNIARYHHERYDGAGYPDGLQGEDIPLEARMMALADVYDALVSERVYKEAYSGEKARQIIRENSGTQFDPTLTEIFLECI